MSAVFYSLLVDHVFQSLNAYCISLQMISVLQLAILAVHQEAFKIVKCFLSALERPTTK